MLRIVLTVLLFLPALLTAVEDAEVLAQARAASELYERRILSLKRTIDDTAATPEQRAQAIYALGQQLDPTTIPYLIAWLDADLHPHAVVEAAAQALGVLGATDAETALETLVQRKEEPLRLAGLNALHTLRLLGPPALTREATATNDHVRATAVTDLGTLTVEDSVEILTDALATDSRNHIRRMAAIGLGRLGNRSAGPALSSALTDRDPLVRRYAAEALTIINYTPAIPNLLMALEANRATNDINRAIIALTGEDFGFRPRDNIVRRNEAIERGFEWWTANASDLQD